MFGSDLKYFYIRYTETVERVYKVLETDENRAKAWLENALLTGHYESPTTVVNTEMTIEGIEE